MTRMDRRALFATGSAAALLAAVGVSAEARPTRGGHLRAALSGGNRAEGWHSWPGGRFLQAARSAVFETLTELAPDGTLQPGLASAWSARDAGRIWELSLRQDVQFHDGSPLRPEDVAASLRAHGFAARATDRVELSVDVPDPSLPLRLARDRLVVFKEEELERGAVHTGTGLYRVRRFDPGAAFLGERVAQHRKDGQAGWFDSVEFVAVSDAEVRADALRQGIVDLIDISHPAGLEQVPELALIEHDGAVVAAARSAVRSELRTGPGAIDDLRFAERWWMAG